MIAPSDQDDGWIACDCRDVFSYVIVSPSRLSIHSFFPHEEKCRRRMLDKSVLYAISSSRGAPTLIRSIWRSSLCSKRRKRDCDMAEGELCEYR